MQTSARKLWLRTAIIGCGYFAIGFALGELARKATSDQTRLIWRWGAWILSGVLYAAHIGYEHFRLRNSPPKMSFHVAAAVAVGGFLLAVAATIHAFTVPTHAPYWLFAVALAAWPLITGLPALVLALVAGVVLTRLPGGS